MPPQLPSWNASNVSCPGEEVHIRSTRTTGATSEGQRRSSMNFTNSWRKAKLKRPSLLTCSPSASPPRASTTLRWTVGSRSKVCQDSSETDHWSSTTQLRGANHCCRSSGGLPQQQAFDLYHQPQFRRSRGVDSGPLHHRPSTPSLPGKSNYYRTFSQQEMEPLPNDHHPLLETMVLQIPAATPEVA